MTRPMLTKPAPCRGTCGRMVRPNNARAEDHPGTVAYRRGGYCKKCISQLPPEAVPAPRVALEAIDRTHCVQCGHKMRPHNAKVADHPGTYRHIGGGHCARCLHYGDIEITDPEGIRPSFDETQARASLEAWLADRARRLDNVHHFRTLTPHTGTAPERIAA